MKVQIVTQVTVTLVIAGICHYYGQNIAIATGFGMVIASIIGMKEK